MDRAERFAEGLKVWGDFQAQWIQTLRKVTSGKSAVLPYNAHKRAILFVEPRRHPATEFVLRNLRACCSWPIIIVHGTDNEQWMKDTAATIRGSFSFLSCRVKDLPNAAYNTLFTHPEFWAELGAGEVEDQVFLIAQTDTALLKPCTEQLEAFADQFDYVGSPWALQCQLCQAALADNCGHMIDQRAVCALAPDMVGNGGLSLRRTKHLLHISRTYSMSAKHAAEDASIVKQWMVPPARKIIPGTSNEDVFFCTCLKLEGKRIASRIAGSAFAMEQCLPLSWDTQGPPVLGVHKPWVYLAPPFVKSVLSTCQIPSNPAAEDDVDAVVHAAGDKEKPADDADKPPAGAA